MERRIAVYECKSEDGQKYTIEQWQEQIPAGHMQDPHATIPGMSRLVTSSGMSVNYIDETTFKIVGTGQIVRVV